MAEDRTPNVLTEIWQGASNPKLDVAIQDQTTPQISLLLGQAIDPNLVLRSASIKDAETIEVTTSGSVPVVGNFVCIKEGQDFTQTEIATVTPIAGDDYDLGLSIPMDHAYTTSSFVCLQNCNMNIDGSISPVEFFIGPEGADDDVQWDINRMIVTMTHGTAGDDGKFGGITALTHGVYFRQEDGGDFNLFNARENADFAIEGYDLTYSTRSGGGGSFGTRARITFNGQDKRGVVLRLSAVSGDRFKGFVRDDLTGLDIFRVKVQGQIVEQ